MALDREHGDLPHNLAFKYAASLTWSPVTVGRRSRSFDFDPVSRSLYIAEDNVVSRLVVASSSEPSVHVRDRSATGYPWTCLSAVSSLRFCPALNRLVATAEGDRLAPAVYYWRAPGSMFDHAETYNLDRTDTIWTCSPCSDCMRVTPNSVPSSDAEKIAVGTAASLALFIDQGSTSVPTIAKYQAPVGVNALAWLTPNTLAFGGRDGAIRLHDCRNRDATHILSHSTMVGRLARVDECRIVCAGLQNTLVLYDIRMSGMTRPLSGHPSAVSSFSGFQPPRSRKRGRGENPYGQARASQQRMPCSQPVVTFPIANAAYYDLGLDVDAEVGLVTGADENGAVLLWSLQNGEIARKFEPEKRLESGERVQCVRFIDDLEGRPRSVWAGLPAGIRRWGL